MLKVVLFDVDGVLANGTPFSHQLERDYGITTAMTAPFFNGKFLECLVGSADMKQELTSHLQQWNWPGSVDSFINYWFTSEHVINVPLVSYAQQLRQQSIPCYLATMQEKYRTAYILEQMGFAHKFDGMFSSAHIGYMKSDPQFFAHIVHALAGIQPQDILFWDDSSRNVETARKAGLSAKVYTDFSAFKEKMQRYLPTST